MDTTAAQSALTVDSDTVESPELSSSASTSAATTIPIIVPAAADTTANDTELRTAVRSFWDLYLELGSQSGPFDGEATRVRLSEHTAGDELNRLLAYFSSNAAAGYVVHGAIHVAPTVVAVTGDSAQVRDCYDDTTSLHRVGDDSRVDTDNPLRHQVLMTFTREAGVWKVSAIRDEGDGCVA